MTSQETVESIREQLADENPKALYADGFDGALVGIARRCGQPSLAVYSSNYTRIGRDGNLVAFTQHPIPQKDRVSYLHIPADYVQIQ